MGLKLGKLYSQSAAAWAAACCYYVSDDERRHTRRACPAVACLPAVVLLCVSRCYLPAPGPCCW